ncbi:hypothetical protein BV898_19172 [Hypsibius exemplaris]|uniref:Dynein attachment factor N-terminal domain-containing protein n=1 Tax=Hypsibius exemplaris TaxID=2072580 RepID=A0A9X6NKZ9_HYPEX|nr:hypothetical protein BV898_19172 [Hypsibius exemplaris]
MAASTAAKGKFFVDTKKLDEMMKEALEQERDYKLRNDAKFRATEQKTATYEEFKGIVDLAHLKPLTKTDQNDSSANGTAKSIRAPWTPLDKK